MRRMEQAVRLVRWVPGIVLAATAATSHASLLVYEGFNYGLASGAAINGATTTGQGLAGTYASNVTLNGTGVSASVTYNSANLSLTNFLSSTGGSLRLAASATSSSNTSSANTNIALNTGAQSGALYSSYLVRTESQNSNDGAYEAAVIFNGTSSQFMSYGDAPDNSASANRKPGVRYGSSTTGYTTASSLSNGVTYLIVSRFTNVGTALSSGSPGVATQWVFSQAQYTNWFNAGQLESSLDTYALGKATQSVSSGTYSFNDTMFVRFAVGSGTNGSSGTQAAYIDELRWGTSLGDVIVVPEPAAALVLATAGMASLLVRRRYSR